MKLNLKRLIFRRPWAPRLTASSAQGAAGSRSSRDAAKPLVPEISRRNYSPGGDGAPGMEARQGRDPRRGARFTTARPVPLLGAPGRTNVLLGGICISGDLEAGRKRFLPHPRGLENKILAAEMSGARKRIAPDFRPGLSCGRGDLNSHEEPSLPPQSSASTNSATTA